jgi:thioredoxin-related protein
VNKIFGLLSVVFLGVNSLSALEFHSYEEARKLQKESGKIIMIDVVRTNCHYCSDMQKNVFDNKEISAWIEERFIPVKVNLDKQQLPLGLKVYFTPTFFFVNKEQKIVKKIPGSWSIEDFKDLTKNIK